MKSLDIELATGELKALLYALEEGVANAQFDDDRQMEQQLRNIYRKITKNVKDTVL